MATDDIKTAEDKKNAELEKEEYYPHSTDNGNTGDTGASNTDTNANANTNAGTDAGNMADETIGVCGCMSMDEDTDTDMDDEIDGDEDIDAILVEEDIIIAGIADDEDDTDDEDDSLNNDITDNTDEDPNAGYRVDASLEDAVRDNLSGDDFVDSGKDFSGNADEELSFSDDSDEKDKKKDKKKDDEKEDTPDYISGDGDKVEELDDKIVSETNKLIAEKRAAREASRHKGCGCGKSI